ncbi:MAG: hypothetical protein AAF493_04865 [Pseudomonadota bacterium]
MSETTLSQATSGVARPEPRSPFIGRGDLVASICDEVRGSPLVTLIGPGGIGKTRLAHRVMAALTDETPDGVHMVELAGLKSGSSAPLVAGTIAAGLGYATIEEAASALRDALALIVLDNCEHVIDGLLGALHPLNPMGSLRILATSREVLGHEAEVVIAVEPLSSDEALSMLKQRAHARGVRSAWSGAQETALRHLCEQLDGIPLALELAAPHLRTFSPDDLARAFAEHDITLGSPRGGSTRQHSLEETVAWTYQRLALDVAFAFRALGAFPGRFRLEDAEAVLTRVGASALSVPEQLDRLVNQSLLQVERTTRGVRYRMLIPVRQCARRWLVSFDELSDVIDCILGYLVQIANRIVERAMTGWSDDVMADVFDYAPTLLTAAQWCTERDEFADRAFAVYLPTWGLVHHAQVDAIAHNGEALLTRWPDPAHPSWSLVACVCATAQLSAGRLERAKALAQAAIESAPPPSLAAVVASSTLLAVRVREGDYEGALGGRIRVRVGPRAGFVSFRPVSRIPRGRKPYFHRAVCRCGGATE